MSVIARGVMAQLVARLNGIQKVRGSNPLSSTIKTHSKGAYKTPLSVSFSMENRPFWGDFFFLSFLLFFRTTRTGFVPFSVSLSPKSERLHKKDFCTIRSV